MGMLTPDDYANLEADLVAELAGEIESKNPIETMSFRAC